MIDATLFTRDAAMMAPGCFQAGTDRIKRASTADVDRADVDRAVETSTAEVTNKAHPDAIERTSLHQDDANVELIPTPDTSSSGSSSLRERAEEDQSPCGSGRVVTRTTRHTRVAGPGTAVPESAISSDAVTATAEKDDTASSSTQSDGTPRVSERKQLAESELTERERSVRRSRLGGSNGPDRKLSPRGKADSNQLPPIDEAA